MSSSQKKIIPINKYSIFELKSGIDQAITSYLTDDLKFTENQYYSNLKILFGILTLICTAIAYFNRIPFPKNYILIIICVVGYWIFSTIYWYIDKYVINNMFFVGIGELKNKNKKKLDVKEMKIFSEVKNRTSKYEIWFEFDFGKEKKTTNKDVINCPEVFDERGYIHKDKLNKIFDKILNEKVSKFE